jgi:hypothetical protein
VVRPVSSSSVKKLQAPMNEIVRIQDGEQRGRVDAAVEAEGGARYLRPIAISSGMIRSLKKSWTVLTSISFTISRCAWRTTPRTDSRPSFSVLIEGFRDLDVLAVDEDVRQSAPHGEMARQSEPPTATVRMSHCCRR